MLIWKCVSKKQVSQDHVQTIFIHSSVNKKIKHKFRIVERWAKNPSSIRLNDNQDEEKKVESITMFPN